MKSALLVTSVVNTIVYIVMIMEYWIGTHQRQRVGGPKHTRPWGLYYAIMIIVVALFVVDTVVSRDTRTTVLNVLPTTYALYVATEFRKWRDEDDDGDGLTSRVKRKIKSFVRVRRLVPVPVAK